MEFWILEAKGRTNKKIWKKISEDIERIYFDSFELSKDAEDDENNNLQNEIYSKTLKNYLNDYGLIIVT